MSPIVQVILLVLAFGAGAFDLIVSRGRSLAGWGVTLLAVWAILKFVAA
jgi:hypothetical protein